MAINPDTAPRSFELVRDNFKTLVRRAGHVLRDPEADWPPLLLVENEAGIHVRPLGDFPVDTPEEKDYLAEVVIPRLVTELDGGRAAVALHSWTVDPLDDPSLASYEGSLADHPARREIVQLLVADAGNCEVWLAPVNRRPGRPPKLGPWQFGSATVSGRFVTPLWNAVAHGVAPASVDEVPGALFAAMAALVEVIGVHLEADEEWPHALALKRGDKFELIDLVRLRDQAINDELDAGEYLASEMQGVTAAALIAPAVLVLPADDPHAAWGEHAEGVGVLIGDKHGRALIAAPVIRGDGHPELGGWAPVTPSEQDAPKLRLFEQLMAFVD